MKSARLALRFFQFTSVLLVAMLTVAGCGSEDSITGSVQDGGDLLSAELVVDPLDGVLDMTDGYTPSQPGPRIERLAVVLGLTEEQVVAFTEAYATFRAAVADLREQVQAGDLTFEEAQAAAAGLRDALEAELQLILTPEQYDLLQELRSKHDARQRPVRDHLARWMDWLQTIGADEAQVAAVLEALADFREGIHELHIAARLGTVPRDEVRDAAMELRDAFDAALQEILTPEQVEQLMELRPDRAGSRGQSQGEGGNPGGRA